MTVERKAAQQLPNVLSAALCFFSAKNLRACSYCVATQLQQFLTWTCEQRQKRLYYPFFFALRCLQDAALSFFNNAHWHFLRTTFLALHKLAGFCFPWQRRSLCCTLYLLVQHTAKQFLWAVDCATATYLQDDTNRQRSKSCCVLTLNKIFCKPKRGNEQYKVLLPMDMFV